jgi:hypothetical protein
MEEVLTAFIMRTPAMQFGARKDKTRKEKRRKEKRKKRKTRNEMKNRKKTQEMN